MSLQSQQIKLIDYRNAFYQGYIKDNQFNGIGAVMTQDFLFSLAIWNKNLIDGQCFTMFPNQKYFFGKFINNNAEGIACYVQSKQCQIYTIYKQNKRSKLLAAVFPYIECVLEIQLNDMNALERQKQHDYKSFPQKWGIVQRILGLSVPDQMKLFTKFLAKSFIENNNNNGQIEEVFGNQYFIRFKNQGLGIRFSLEGQNLRQIGLFNSNNILQHIGKRIISYQKKVKQQGIYSKPQTLIRYQQRPPIIKKTYRDYFRTGIDFQNKFIQLTNVQKIDQQFQKLITDLKDNTTKRIAQQLIQHLDQQQPSQVVQKPKPKHNPRPTIMMADVSLQDLKQQLNRSISHKKSHEKSPYRQYQTNTKPAQLKYTSRSPHNHNNQKTNFLTNKTPQKYSNQNYSSKYQYTPNKHIKRRLNFDDTKQQNDKLMQRVRQNTRQRQIQRQRRQLQLKRQLQRQRQIRYPIEQGLRTMGTNNAYKSPIKLQHRPVKYKYTEQDSTQNPQRTNFKPQPYKYSNTRNDRQVSPFNEQTSNRRKYTPSKNQRTQRLSNLYDEIQAQNNQPLYSKPGDRDRKYNFNHGKGYQYNNKNQQLDQSLGLVRTGRKVQSPIKRTTTSPYKPQTKYTPYTQKKPYQRNQRNYDRFRGQNYKDEAGYVDYTRKNQKKPNYGYFDKNKI